MTHSTDTRGGVFTPTVVHSPQPTVQMTGTNTFPQLIKIMIHAQCIDFMSELKLMKGNEALAEAAIRAGADAYFGYPITPQSEVIEYLMKLAAAILLGIGYTIKGKPQQFWPIVKFRIDTLKGLIGL